MKETIIIYSLVAILSFGLGWFAKGDQIYGSMFKGIENNVRLK